jgi:hypothetical protein
MMHTKKRHVANGAGRLRKVRVGKGVEVRPGRPRIVVEFDDEMFKEIRTRAIREGTSFCEQVRLLCQWGLEEDENYALTDDLKKGRA